MSGIGKTFSASRRQKLPEFLIIVVVFFVCTRIIHCLIPLIHFSPEQRLQVFWTFFFSHPFHWTEFFETLKNCSSWAEGKTFRVCRINWIDCWHGKGNSYWKRWTNGNWKFPSTNSRPKEKQWPCNWIRLQKLCLHFCSAKTKTDGARWINSN